MEMIANFGKDILGLENICMLMKMVKYNKYILYINKNKFKKYLLFNYYFKYINR